MGLTRQQIDHIHTTRSASAAKRYTRNDGVVFIGTVDGRLLQQSKSTDIAQENKPDSTIITVDSSYTTYKELDTIIVTNGVTITVDDANYRTKPLTITNAGVNEVSVVTLNFQTINDEVSQSLLENDSMTIIPSKGNYRVI